MQVLLEEQGQKVGRGRKERQSRDDPQAAMTDGITLRVDSQETAPGFGAEVWERRLGRSVAGGQDLSPWMGKGASIERQPPPRVSTSECEEQGGVRGHRPELSPQDQEESCGGTGEG